MKGYDACVFPREGEPVLLCLEASAEDAARTAWTDGRPLRRAATTTTTRGRRSRARSTLALEASRELRPRRRSSSRSARRPPTGWSASRRRSRRPGSTPGRTRPTRRRCSRPRARSRPTQEIERIRLANEICAAAMEHVRAELRPGMKESEAAAIWQGFVHGEGTGWRGPGRARARLLARLVGRRDQDVHRDRRPARVSADEPTLFEIWVCADGYWCDHTKLLCPGELRADYRELEAALLEVYEPRDRPLPPGREPRRARPARSATASPRPATPASRRTRSATASARARTSRRTRTRRAAARSPSGWCSRSSPGCYWEGGGGLRVEDNFLITSDGRREALARSRTGW